MLLSVVKLKLGKNKVKENLHCDFMFLHFDHLYFYTLIDLIVLFLGEMMFDFCFD